MDNSVALVPEYCTHKDAMVIKADNTMTTKEALHLVTMMVRLAQIHACGTFRTTVLLPFAHCFDDVCIYKR